MENSELVSLEIPNIVLKNALIAANEKNRILRNSLNELNSLITYIPEFDLLPFLEHQEEIKLIFQQKKYESLLNYTKFRIDIFSVLAPFQGMKDILKNCFLTRHIINHTANLNYTDAHGRKMIHFVCAHASLPNIKYILSKDKNNLNSKTNLGNYPFQFILSNSLVESRGVAICPNTNYSYPCVKQLLNKMCEKN